ncbi:hypothetical protein C5167_006132 [Papaver somniferum]|uniref:Uncharacterized protein n=1 Tax=Papaver somniferum TaxID=3469 RepID=A0A4Y7JCL1_PAPSO|nr:hypothetical protein C5167_006132 [Papaver somniferum]
MAAAPYKTIQLQVTFTMFTLRQGPPKRGRTIMETYYKPQSSQMTQTEEAARSNAPFSSSPNARNHEVEL